eukprot:1280625-Alexandrium_andersonii.AAC.1
MRLCTAQQTSAHSASASGPRQHGGSISCQMPQQTAATAAPIVGHLMLAPPRLGRNPSSAATATVSGFWGGV